MTCERDCPPTGGAATTPAPAGRAAAGRAAPRWTVATATTPDPGAAPTRTPPSSGQVPPPRPGSRPVTAGTRTAPLQVRLSSLTWVFFCVLLFLRRKLSGGVNFSLRGAAAARSLFAGLFFVFFCRSPHTWGRWLCINYVESNWQKRKSVQVLVRKRKVCAQTFTAELQIFTQHLHLSSHVQAAGAGKEAWCSCCRRRRRHFCCRCFTPLTLTHTHLTPHLTHHFDC